MRGYRVISDEDWIRVYTGSGLTVPHGLSLLIRISSAPVCRHSASLFAVIGVPRVPHMIIPYLRSRAPDGKNQLAVFTLFEQKKKLGGGSKMNGRMNVREEVRGK